MGETRERQYEPLVELQRRKGLTSLGVMTSHAWDVDPKRLGFTLARYKFVAKMLAGRRHVLEVGCSDAFGTRIVVQEVGALTAIDFDPAFVADVNERMDPKWPFICKVHDVTASPAGNFDAAYSLDVLEHIAPADERRFLTHVAASLGSDGVAIFGTPSLESQAYASEISRAGHVNCKSLLQLKDVLLEYFANVFMFGMNDETLHTGYPAMCHYLLALCCGPRR
jgi:2-polyprenyl-3-methyl-5-hydroxy-6-metoxy-1,4-benzoquinol methylase